MSQSEEIQKMQLSMSEVRKDVEYLRRDVVETLSAIKENTAATNSLNNQFTIYATKHDEVRKDIDDLKLVIEHKDLEIQELRISAIQNKSDSDKRFERWEPTLKLIDGLVTKLVTAMLCAVIGGGAVVSAIFPFIQKLTS